MAPEKPQQWCPPHHRTVPCKGLWEGVGQTRLGLAAESVCCHSLLSSSLGPGVNIIITIPAVRSLLDVLPAPQREERHQRTGNTKCLRDPPGPCHGNLLIGRGLVPTSQLSHEVRVRTPLVPDLRPARTVSAPSPRQRVSLDVSAGAGPRSSARPLVGGPA